MDFDNVNQLYTQTNAEVNATVQNIFDLAGLAMAVFNPTLIIVSTIYIALMGYAIISGWIVMSAREAATRFSKVVIVLILANLFTNYAGDMYDFAWRAPVAIGDFFASSLDSLSLYSLVFGSEFDSLMNQHSLHATSIGQNFAKQYPEKQSIAIAAWGISMAPVFVITISIIIAKVISAVLFIIAPVVFILALLGLQNNYLMTWVKAIALTFLTVIIIYILGTVVLDIVFDQLIAMASRAYDAETPINLIEFAPLGVLSVFGIILVSQATTIASSIMGMAAINTQQATGFMQIGALQSAGAARTAGAVT